MIREEEAQPTLGPAGQERKPVRVTPADIPGGHMVLGAVILPFAVFAPAVLSGLSPVGSGMAYVGQALLMAAMVLLIGRKVDFDSFGWARLDGRSWLWILAIGVALGYFSDAVQWLISGSALTFFADADRLAWLDEQLSEILQGDGRSTAHMATAAVLSAIGTIVLAPIIEEFLFRGFLLRRWAAKWSIPTGLVVSSLVFAAIHGFTAASAFIWGVVLGLLYLWTRNLLVPIGVHIAGNTIAVLSNHIDHFLGWPHVARTLLADPILIVIIALPILLISGAALWIMLRLVRRQAPVDVRAPWTGGQLRLERRPLRANSH
jgi:membrane protease YdiL (CAAX protease family)